MTTLVFAVMAVSLAIFLIACVARFRMYAKAPIHLRWELYPVPHEEAKRVPYGGSRFEEVDYWTKPAHFNLWGELSVMVPEILFLKALHEFNPKMWRRSFPFHFGLYLLITAILLVGASALASLAAPGWGAGGAGVVAGWAIAVTGGAGIALAMLGACALLAARLTDRALVRHTTPADIANLIFFLLALGTLAAGILLRPPGSAGVTEIAAALVRWDTSLQTPGLLGAGLVLCALLVAYIPLTHMSHFIGKYFTYHAVRWDDRLSEKGGEIQAKVAEYLTYRPRWSAPHIQGNGVKTWADIATTNPTQRSKQ